MNGQYVAYYRVSTKRQGVSGLGLEAQRNAVLGYLNGGNGTLQGEYTEIESGRSVRNRPVLRQALGTCKKEKATLVIAKLDRLARNVAFISRLIESHVHFVAADMPEADKTMLQMYAVMAEHERDMISRRTKEALAVAKARGTVLGKHGKVLAQERKAASVAFAIRMQPTIEALKREGHTSVRAISHALNTRAIPTSTVGGSWHPNSVQRLLARLSR
jgi:DNA invertase Pin-like site-specific DNA recombinase